MASDRQKMVTAVFRDRANGMPQVAEQTRVQLAVDERERGLVTTSRVGQRGFEVGRHRRVYRRAAPIAARATRLRPRPRRRWRARDRALRQAREQSDGPR